jgi:type I restriction enzyme M protein
VHPIRHGSVAQAHMNQQTLSAFIWSVADLLRGDYKRFNKGISSQGRVNAVEAVFLKFDCIEIIKYS